uniref:7TM_GPCR_Srx domain-containing protein n=1 Tax=Steinernema glaseri TaxID=37863 RepID=A0A1I7YJL5_9BILA
MSIGSLASNSYLVVHARQRKVFGHFFGHVIAHRSLMEALNSFITMTFFATNIYWAYEVPTWFNTTITTFYIFNLSSAYVLHLVISINRCVAVFLPLRYETIFDKRRSAATASFLVILIGALVMTVGLFATASFLVILIGALVMAVGLFGRRSRYTFSRSIYDIMVVECGPAPSNILPLQTYAAPVQIGEAHVYDYATLEGHIPIAGPYMKYSFYDPHHLMNSVIVIWSMCSFSALTVDLVTLVRLAMFDVMLGYLINGVTPLIMNKELRPCGRRRQTVSNVSVLSREI